MKRARRPSAPEAVYVLLAFAFALVAEAQYVSLYTRERLPLLNLQVFSALLAVSLALAIGEVRTGSKESYGFLIVGHVLATLATIPFSAGIPLMEYAVYLVPVLGICLHNPYPASTAISAVYTALVVAVRVLVLSVSQTGADVIWFRSIEYVVVTAILVTSEISLVHYREAYIRSTRENRRMDALVDRLSKANLRYQEYAKSIEESSMETERKRITREIHDIVGYTLTNNITMMEAITDMIHKNPLGVAHLVDMARDNAQDGLARIRESLYLLRRTGTHVLTGVEALRRLLRVYHHGTGVEVNLQTGDTPWDFPEEIDSAFYHMVQECLINSFRHGRASRVDILLSSGGHGITLRVSDNGSGAVAVNEGIGLGGMRERLVRLGGSLSYRSWEHGFSVAASLPRTGGTSTGEGGS
jgi:signal transduction histidine kinase